MSTTDMPSCILNLKIYILTSKSEKSIIINDYLSDVGVKFEQVARRKSILGKELINIDSTATSSRSCQKRSL